MSKYRKTKQNPQMELHKISFYKSHIWLFFIGLSLLICGIAVGPKAIEAKMAAFNSKKNDEESIGVNALMSAVVSHDVDGVRFFVKAGDSLINQKNIGGATALHLAARQKDYEIVQILVENKADVNVLDNEKWTPLMRAALAGQGDIVTLLLDSGANASLLNSAGESALYHATLSGCNQCLNALFNKFNFIKLMNGDSLKSQLSDSYIIAQNHENQEAQGLLSDYLDRVKDMEKLLPEESVANDSSQTQEKTSGQGKTFKFISSKNGKVKIFKTNQAAKVSKNLQDIKEIDSQTKAQDLEMEKIDKSKVSTEVEFGTANPVDSGAIKTKFKFIQGAKGKIVKKKKLVAPKIIAVNQAKPLESSSPVVEKSVMIPPVDVQPATPVTKTQAVIPSPAASATTNSPVPTPILPVQKKN